MSKLKFPLDAIELITFKECWEHRKVEVISLKKENETKELEVPFIGFEELLKNKRATGRRKDEIDIYYLTKHRV